MRINSHGHVLPEPHQIPRFLKEKKLFWIDDNKKFCSVMNSAFNLAKSQKLLVTIGIRPTYASTGYGYIKICQTFQYMLHLVYLEINLS